MVAGLSCKDRAKVILGYTDQSSLEEYVSTLVERLGTLLLSKGSKQECFEFGGKAYKGKGYLSSLSHMNEDKIKSICLEIIKDRKRKRKNG